MNYKLLKLLTHSDLQTRCRTTGKMRFFHSIALSKPVYSWRRTVTKMIRKAMTKT